MACVPVRKTFPWLSLMLSTTYTRVAVPDRITRLALDPEHPQKFNEELFFRVK